MKKSLTFQDFYKSAVDQKNVKLGVVTTWIIYSCKGNMPKGVDLLTLPVETIYNTSNDITLYIYSCCI